MKKIFGQCMVLLCYTCIFSQDLEIPDVSTAINSDGTVIDIQAIPDFSQILPSVETDFLLSLDLPSEILAEPIVEVKESEIANPPIIFEGIVGGGYPSFFLGDIRLSQNTEKNPFDVQFLHTTQNGLGVHSASDGFTKNNTALLGDVLFALTDIYTLQAKADYEMGSVGFQNKSALFSLGSYYGLNFDVGFGIETSSIWNIDIFGSFNWMHRYLGKKNTTNVLTQSHGLGAEVGLAIAKNFKYVDFYICNDYSYAGLENSTSHRYELDLGFGVPLLDTMSLDFGLGLVYENYLQLPVLVPFSIGFEYLEEFLSLKISGGMKTHYADYQQLQKRYPFTNIVTSVTEEAQWFSALDIRVPFLENYGFGANIQFNKTAFNQGSYLPSYESEDAATGLYTIDAQDILTLDTALDFSANVGMFGLMFGWNASWFDILPEENSHELYISSSVTSRDGLWGAQLSIGEYFNEVAKIDYIPDVSFKAFVSIFPSFELELQVMDLVKLCMGEDRYFAGKYVTNTSFVGLFARFNF